MPADGLIEHTTCIEDTGLVARGDSGDVIMFVGYKPEDMDLDGWGDGYVGVYVTHPWFDPLSARGSNDRQTDKVQQEYAH